MKTIPQDEPSRLLQARIGDTLLRAAKSACGGLGISFQEWMALAVREKLDRDNPEWLAQLPEPMANGEAA